MNEPRPTERNHDSATIDVDQRRVVITANAGALTGSYAPEYLGDYAATGRGDRLLRRAAR